MAKHKQYIQNPKFNTVVQANKIEKLAQEVNEQRQKIQDVKDTLSAVIDSYDKHLEYLVNFAKHDMGNALQNIYAVLKTSNIGSDDNELITNSLKDLENTLNQFQSLLPYEQKDIFDLNKLMNSAEILSRPLVLDSNNLSIEYIFDRNNHKCIKQPYQGCLQVLLNIIRNAVKSFINLSQKEKKILVFGEFDKIEPFIYLIVKNNGIEIPDEDINRIFEYQYSTSGGSGIGLYHAKYLSESIGGSITLERFKDDFTTIFTLKIPTNNQ